jgi:uncharacterized membrane protein YgcG
MHKFLKLAVMVMITFGGLTTVSNNIKALSFDYPEYNVDINVYSDTVFDVKETITLRFYGETHGVRRDITLNDPTRCVSTNLTCGGFSQLIVLGVYDEDGKKLDESDYKTYEYTEYGVKYFRFERELWPDGKNLNGDEVKWSVEYRILGGIEWIGEGLFATPYFYWNLLPENRNGNVSKSNITINFPDGVSLERQKLQVYSDYQPKITFDELNRKITLSLEDLNSYGPFTVSYGFEQTELKKPGSLTYKVIKPTNGLTVFLNNTKISAKSENTIYGFPIGEQKLTFKRTGYETKDVTVNLAEGENKSIEVELEIKPWMSAFIVLNWVIFCLGFLTIPLAVILVWMRYRSRGRDKNMPKTIIPLFEPPKDVRPYLLGTLKDEKVDKQDIVGTIIDLAYRGYLKIKEVKKNKEYELIKLEGKKGDPGLNKLEKEIYEAIFNGKDTRSTKDLRTYFPQKYVKIINNIYIETVDRGYFAKSPSTTRNTYLGAAVVLIGLGIFLLIGVSAAVVSALGIFSFFSPALGLVVGGMALFIAAFYMPAKTELGSKTYADILGFKMYLHTAERYRLQKLGPDEFEKYLSYAVVFGIEKEWAEKFKDIYKRVPDWYEGTTPNVYDAIWISTFAHSFSSAAVASMTPASSSSGGGWSGSGGSFGGFSGGGGGGGSSGGW